MQSIIRRVRSRWRADGGYGMLLRVAVPLILSNGAFSLQQFIDRIFLAWYSPQAIAAAPPAGILNFMILSLFINTCGYAGTFVAQYHGAGRDDRIGPTIWQALFLAAVGGALMTLLVPAAAPIFRLIGHAPPVQRDEVIYFRILAAGSILPIMNAAFTAFYSGLGRTWPVMWVNLVVTGANVVLDYLLIFGNLGFPRLGVAGAAIATVIATGFGTVAFAWTLFRSRRHARYSLKTPRIELDLLARLIRYGLPSGLQVTIDVTGFTIFVLLLGRIGTDSLAATNIALNVNMLAFMPVVGLGIAVSVVVGQHVGRGLIDGAEFTAYSGVHVALFYMIVLGSAYVLLPGLFLLPFTANAPAGAYSSIAATARILLRFVAFYSLFDALNVTFSSAVKGAGDTRFVVIVQAVLSLGLVVAPMGLIVFILHWGIFSAWSTATLYITTLGIVFFLRFRSGVWKRMRIIEPTAEVHQADRA